MRTTITLDDDVYAAAMQMAQASGQRFGKVLSELARQGLTPPALAGTRKRSRWPTFHVPPGTPPITIEQVQAVIDEEGLI